MNSDQILDLLKNALREPLPGEKAHSQMAPTGRVVNYNLIPDKETYRKSAVSIILYPSDNSLKCLMIKRPDYDGVHGGQMSFPGGKMDETDEDELFTAIRETHEEIGLQIATDHLLGEMSSVYIPVSKFKVHPFLFFYPENPVLIADPREVDEIFHFELELLSDISTITTTEIIQQGRKILSNVPCYRFHDKTIWGASALMLSELQELIRNQK